MEIKSKIGSPISTAGKGSVCLRGVWLVLTKVLWVTFNWYYFLIFWGMALVPALNTEQAGNRRPYFRKVLRRKERYFLQQNRQVQRERDTNSCCSLQSIPGYPTPPLYIYAFGIRAALHTLRRHWCQGGARRVNVVRGWWTRVTRQPWSTAANLFVDVVSYRCRREVLFRAGSARSCEDSSLSVYDHDWIAKINP